MRNWGISPFISYWFNTGHTSGIGTTVEDDKSLTTRIIRTPPIHDQRWKLTDWKYILKLENAIIKKQGSIFSTKQRTKSDEKMFKFDVPFYSRTQFISRSQEHQSSSHKMSTSDYPDSRERVKKKKTAALRPDHKPGHALRKKPD